MSISHFAENHREIALIRLRNMRSAKKRADRLQEVIDLAYDELIAIERITDSNMTAGNCASITSANELFQELTRVLEDVSSEIDIAADDMEENI